jgi:hypothetical protein
MLLLINIMASKRIFGSDAFFHYFEDFSEYIRVINYIPMHHFGVGIGKFIILHDQISTKTGKTIGKKQENTYLFISIFMDESKIREISEDGIIKEDNFINLDDIGDEEFDEYDNLKKATTLMSYKEFMDYVEKHNLG